MKNELSRKNLIFKYTEVVTEAHSWMGCLRGRTESGQSVIAFGGKSTGRDREGMRGHWAPVREEADGIVAAGRWSLCYSHKAQRKPFSKERAVKSLMCQKMSRRMEVEEIIIDLGRSQLSLASGIAMIKAFCLFSR